MLRLLSYIIGCILFVSCSKNDNTTSDSPNTFQVLDILNGDESLSKKSKGVFLDAELVIHFDEAINENQLNQHIQLLNKEKSPVALTLKVLDNGKKVAIKPTSTLSALSEYQVLIKSSLKSKSNGVLAAQTGQLFTTAYDPSDKFKRITEDELLTLVQKQTFSYFWDFAHPSSGMIRERSSSTETVTSGGTGFGIMAIVTAVSRNFISRAQGLERIKKIVGFLKTADRYHGAYSHWYNGSTGKTQPFSEKDNGADLVETALLFQGLLTAREYFGDANLTAEINKLYQAVEWNYFQNGQQVLFWHWSPTHGWEMNMKIAGWNESLIVYVLAAGSTNFSIDKSVYDQGWAKNGAMKNGKSFFNYLLPLGPDQGGPLFLSQYSFLGINPLGLRDNYADYEQQTRNHALIKWAYCKANPKGYYGYSEQSWGLTAGDLPNGYGAQSPSNDPGIITPTAALTSMPFVPKESLDALEFFYYKLGDKLWDKYGFKDGYSLDQAWFADSYIAIDQGPIIIGIENYRSKLIWNTFMKASEVKNGLKKLGFTSPNL